MSNAANGFPPGIHGGVNTAGFQSGTAVLFFSVYLAAHLFIDRRGSIRLNPTCGPSSQIPFEEEMVKLCWPVGGDVREKSTTRNPLSRCMYASATGGHLLVVDRKSGRLKAISLPVKSTNGGDYCMQFLEDRLQQWPYRASILTCAESPNRADSKMLALTGRRLNGKLTCSGRRPGRFKQVVEHTRDPRSRRMTQFSTNLNIYAHQLQACPNFEQLWRDCPKTLRPSYPLLQP